MKLVSKLISASVCDETEKESRGKCEDQGIEADKLLMKMDDRIP